MDSLIDLVELFGTRNDYRPVRHRGNIGGYFTSCAVMEPRFHFLFLSFKKNQDAFVVAGRQILRPAGPTPSRAGAPGEPLASCGRKCNHQTQTA